MNEAKRDVTGMNSRTGHLRGMDAIAGCYGVSRRTVRGWIAHGAPIFYAGRKYQASYAELCAWFVDAGRGEPLRGKSSLSA